jgi:hypothetical protein
MANLLAPELMKRVIYSKYLMKWATTLQAEGHELAFSEALLAAHDSVEMLMRVVIDKLRVPPPHDFMGFWKVVKDAKGKQPSRKAALDRLNHERVGFKHKGIPPNPAIVGDLLRNAIAFCEDISREYLDVEYESVSLADLIHNADAREKVKEAEVRKSNGDLATAFTNLGLAFDELFSEARQKNEVALVGPIPIMGRRWVQDLASLSLESKLQEMAETIDALILGIEPAKLRRFTVTTPLRQHAASGAVTTVWRRDPNLLTSQDFDFCYKFVVDFGLRLLTA